jgi:hypothetical protein
MKTFIFANVTTQVKASCPQTPKDEGSFPLALSVFIGIKLTK